MITTIIITFFVTQMLNFLLLSALVFIVLRKYEILIDITCTYKDLISGLTNLTQALNLLKDSKPQVDLEKALDNPN